MHQDWEIAGLLLIYAVVYFGLFALVQNNWLSLDYLLRSRRQGDEFLDKGEPQ